MAIENKELATVKKPGQVEYITREQLFERLQEIKKCREDIVYFCENYYRIQSLDKGLHVVKLYDVQKQLLRFMVDQNRAVVCASRQSGKSSCYCMYVLWLTCFHPDKRVMMLAQKESTALELLDRIKVGYTYLPTWLKPGCEEFNKSSVKFANRSTIMGFASSSQGARGQSCNVLILDEFAFVPHNIADALFTAVYPVVSSSKNGKVIIVSTPNGKHNLYYDLWKKANNKDDPDNIDGWRAFRMDWWQVPGRDEKWKQAQLAAIGPTRFAQEFDNQFLDDIMTVKLIPDDIADKFRIKLTEYKTRGTNQGKQLFITSPDKKKNYPFTMWIDFDPKRTYLASADVAEGVGKDSSVLYIWDVTDLSNIRLCCKFSDNQTSILEFAYVANEILKLYANPYLACESNGISLGFIEQLRVTYAYENFVRMNKGGCGIDSHWVLKTKACLWCRDMLMTAGLGFSLYDSELVDEFSSFIKKDGLKHTLYSAIKGAHDDHMMAFIWMCWIMHPDNVEKYYDVLEKFSSSTTGLTIPSRLAPYYPYTPTQIQDIRESQQVRDFQFYKSMNTECDEGVESRDAEVQERRRSPRFGSQEMDTLMQKKVLSEDDVIRMMRNTVEGRRMEGSFGIGRQRGPGRLGHDSMFSAGGNQNARWLDYDRDMLNVVWSSWDNPDNGIDGLFGYGDDSFEGPQW